MGDEALAAQMQTLVRYGVDRRSASGLERAMAAFGRHVGLSERRVYAYYYGRVRRPLATEYLALHQRFKDWLDDDIERLTAERERLAALLRK